MSLELRPTDRVTANLGASYAYATGYLHPFGRYDSTGLPPDPARATAEAIPGVDLASAFSVDHAWAGAAMGPATLGAGLMPISWGSSWLLNPTDRVNPRGWETLLSDEAEAVPALSVTLAFGWQFAATGYLQLSDSGRSGLVRLDQARPEDLPYGLRLQAYLTDWELTIGTSREVFYDADVGTREREYRLLADLTGNIWDVGVTAEAALLIGGESDWSVSDALESTVGLTYLVPEVDVELLLEYVHLGSGASTIGPDDLAAAPRPSSATIIRWRPGSSGARGTGSPRSRA
ncbi:MAG: hypothetical protein ACOC0E_05650 [Spirochaetota bacterium]